ncbi:MAG: helix-turn-helix domain-containing protein [Sulfuriferula sp.]
MEQTKQPKKPAQQDWHPADVVAALWKRGTSLRRLSIENGYINEQSLRHGVRGCSVRGEQIIAKAIGLHPMKIWPSRYTTQGERIMQRMTSKTPADIPQVKFTETTCVRNGNNKVAK